MVAASLLLVGCLPARPSADTQVWTLPDAVPSTNVGDGDASFRISCWRSHIANNDPIVFPGQAGASHSHTFFGNTGTDHASTASSISGSGFSTCEGGTANRTAYWVPTIFDSAHDNRILDAAPMLDALQVYYKSGYRGVHSESIVPFPEGFRMIAGSPVNESEFTYWDCITTSHAQDVVPDASNQYRFWQIPQHCGPGQFLQLTIEFPQCWDGVNLDSPNHRSHVAYGSWVPTPDPEAPNCPSTHPVPLAQVTEHVRWLIPHQGTPVDPLDPDCTSAGWTFDAHDWSGWNGYGEPETWPEPVEGCVLLDYQIDVADLVLSSDEMMGHGNPGDSAHADWFNGWDEDVFDAILDSCFRPAKNCHMGLVGFPIGEAPVSGAPTYHGLDWAKLGDPAGA